jgi:cytochrome c556
MAVKVLNLKEVKVSEKKRVSLMDIMSNLPKMNDALKDEDIFDIETVREAIAVEMETKRRPATIGRLVGRFKTLLSAEIDRELYGR